MSEIKDMRDIRGREMTGLDAIALMFLIGVAGIIMMIICAIGAVIRFLLPVLTIAGIILCAAYSIAAFIYASMDADKRNGMLSFFVSAMLALEIFLRSFVTYFYFVNVLKGFVMNIEEGHPFVAAFFGMGDMLLCVVITIIAVFVDFLVVAGWYLLSGYTSDRAGMAGYVVSFILGGIITTGNAMVTWKYALFMRGIIERYYYESSLAILEKFPWLSEFVFSFGK